MKKKHTGKIIVLLALMFASVFGQYIGELLNANMNYNLAGGYAFLLSLANLCLITAVMMLVPFITRIINRGKLPYASGKKLCLWNSIILFVVSVLLMAIVDIGFVGGVGALIYYFINKWIFVCDPNSAEIQTAEPIPQQKRPVHSEPTVNRYIADGKKQPDESKKLTKYRVFIVLSIVVITVCLVIAFVMGGMGDPGNEDASYITYDSYYVGIRSITVSNESTAERIYNEWKDGKATEEFMVALMDKYGKEQGGGQLYIVEPGMWIEEVDAWCFDRTRQVGDVAIIENDYGYTICYFSSVIER